MVLKPQWVRNGHANTPASPAGSQISHNRPLWLLEISLFPWHGAMFVLAPAAGRYTIRAPNGSVVECEA